MDLKLLFLTTEYPPYIFGGGGVFAYNLTRYLSRMGVSVCVISKGMEFKEKEFNNDNIVVYRVKTPEIPPKHVWFQLYGLKKIISIINKIKPDIIHANSFSAAIIFRYLKNSHFNYPLITTLHGYPRHYLRLSLHSLASSRNIGQLSTYVLGYPVWDLLLSNEVKYSDIIVTMSSYVIESLYTDYKVNRSKLIYIPNGIDLSLINDSICKYYKQSLHNRNKYIVLTGGRMFYEKGLFLIPYIAKKLKTKGYKNIEFIIFGDGPYRDFINKVAEKLDILDIVRILGALPHRIVLSLICLADIVLVPSIYELMPMFMLEAIALKKPVIALKSMYIEDIVSKGISLELAQGISDMAEKIVNVINRYSEWSKIAESNFEVLKREFEISVIAQKYLNIYEQLLEED